MAETSSETKRARLERELYDNIKNLIIQAIRDGGSDSAQSIHSAMAQAMCDTITDIKGPYQSQITQTFVERWSLTTSHMEHKLNYFMRMLLVKNKKKASTLHSVQRIPVYVPADIESFLREDKGYQAPSLAAAPKPAIKPKTKSQHNLGCRELVLAYGRLSFCLRQYMPALASALSEWEAEKQQITDQVPETFRQTLLEANDDKIQDVKRQQREAQKTCFFCLEKEEAAMAKIDVSSAGKDGFNSVPIFDEVTPLDERKRSVELSDEDKAHDYTQDLAELRRRFEAKKQAPKKKKAAAKPAKKAGGVKRKGREAKFAVGEKVEVLWGTGVNRGWYPAEVVENKGGYLINYFNDDAELEDTEQNVPVARIRKPKKKRVSFVQEEEGGDDDDDDEDDEDDDDEDEGDDPAAKRARRTPAK